ncbi:hypothetical protein K456DRAFT_404739 [Colletotrichum gloeosporioides 23]|nr:hypothetical protein K456DRAFT_404739 [Colletotrichum gloeosporioides 23]
MAPPQRRERIVPCGKCREKHLKCDGETPCSGCKKSESHCVRVSNRFRFKRMVASEKKYSFDVNQPWLHASASGGKSHQRCVLLLISTGLDSDISIATWRYTKASRYCRRVQQRPQKQINTSSPESQPTDIRSLDHSGTAQGS